VSIVPSLFCQRFLRELSSSDGPCSWFPPSLADNDKSARRGNTGLDVSRGIYIQNLIGTWVRRRAPTDPLVMQFGQRLVTDHSKAGDELKSLAIQSKVTPPPDVSKSSRNYLARNSIRPTRTR